MKSFDANYHCHTSRCGHAYGLDEEYVEAAISSGFKVIGFTDHVILPGIHQPGMRADENLLEDYFDSINALKEKYKDQVEIHVGFECEWYGEVFENYYRDLLESGKCEYLILGQHCDMPVFNQIHFYGSYPNQEAAIRAYAKDLIAGLRTGMFSYVCHPDMPVLWFGRFDALMEQVSREICLAAKEMNVPLEVNMGPTRFAHFDIDNPDVYLYPYPKFWDIAAEVGNDVIIGVDAHHPDHYLSKLFGAFVEFCDKHHLHRLERLTFRQKGKDF